MSSKKEKSMPEFDRQEAKKISKSEAVARRQREVEKLSEFCLADLRKSGLTDDTISEMLPYCAKAGDGIALLTEVIGFASYQNVSLPQSGDFYFLPYLHTQGFARVKLEKQIGTAKYLSPMSAVYPNQHMYFLMSEVAKLRKANVPLILTEGEKKVAALTQAARAEQITCACAGFAGVSCWERCEEWPHFPVAGRTCYIGFDADYRKNRNVQLEIVKLALWQWIRKASDIRLLSWDEKDKGADDYLVAGGKLKDLIENSKPLTEIFKECNLVQFADVAAYAAKYRYTKDLFAALFETCCKDVYEITNRTAATTFKRECQKLIREAETTTDQDTRPTIRIEGGKLPDMVDAAERVLVECEAGIYQRSRMLVRLTESNTVSHKGVRRDERPFAIITPVEATWLCEKLTRVARWQKEDKRTSSGWKDADCPKVVAETLIARCQWSFPHLSGIITAPTLRYDGSILETPGYDAQSCLLYKPACDYPKIPDNPTWDDANEAIERIFKIIHEFPFDTPASRSVAISAMLTGLVRKSLRVAPAHGFTAPTMGTGKTLQADLASLVTTGHTATKITRPDGPEEEKKVFMSLLLEGDSVICIDNIDDAFSSDALCTILTETEWGNRLLGVNKTPKLPTNCMWFLTGNNMQLMGDITDRAIMATMDAKIEKPDEREFEIKDIREYVLANRAEIVKDCLTILRAYHVAGRPAQQVKSLNRFPDWSEWVRGAVIWASSDSAEITEDGHPFDPCATRAKLQKTDPIRSELGSFLQVWFDNFGSAPQQIRDILKKAAEKDNEVLRDAIADFAGDRNGCVSPKRLSCKVLKLQGRIENGLRIILAGTAYKKQIWKVLKVEG